MHGNSSKVHSSQIGPHRALDSTLRRRKDSSWNKPFHDFSEEIFRELHELIVQPGKPLIFDSGCGTGRSSRTLASMHPEHVVVGIDQSIARLKIASKVKSVSDNCVLVHGDVEDIWRLALSANIELSHHYLLYPNPWPKAKHFMRRWHAHPGFPTLLALGGELTLRTNWEVYALEFQRALNIFEYPGSSIKEVSNATPISAFEEKYLKSEHTLYELRCTLKSPQDVAL